MELGSLELLERCESRLGSVYQTWKIDLLDGDLALALCPWYVWFER